MVVLVNSSNNNNTNRHLGAEGLQQQHGLSGRRVFIYIYIYTHKTTLIDV